MPELISSPIADSYWVHRGNLLAGEYPFVREADLGRRRLRWLLGLGINVYLDLTQAGEPGLMPYADVLLEEASVIREEVTHHRMPIPDFSTPSVSYMKEILDYLDAELSTGRSVYIHCYGGVGRTGTVVGCFLSRRGYTGPAALQRIALWRENLPGGWRSSPETAEQRQFVLDWNHR